MLCGHSSSPVGRELLLVSSCHRPVPAGSHGKGPSWKQKAQHWFSLQVTALQEPRASTMRIPDPQTVCANMFIVVLSCYALGALLCGQR